MTTNAQKQNLIKLAQGLLHGASVSYFHMRFFATNMHGKTCGAVGCAIGHAPYFGVYKYKHEDWREFSKRALISDEYSDEWSWCFDSKWSKVDNSRRGAAKRIIWYLQYGLPNDWVKQMMGKSPLCYKKVKDFCPQWLKENT